MNPAVFLANPNSGGLKAFLQVVRPGVRKWVKNHYENFRMQFAPPARGFPGSHSIQSGFMFRHHVFGEYHTYYAGFPVLRTYDFYGAHPRYYPSMNSDFDTWPWLDSEGGIFLDGEPVEANALQSDLQQGGQSTYFLLPSLGKLVIDNLRLGLATPKELARFMAVTIMTFDKEQGKEERKSPEADQMCLIPLRLVDKNTTVCSTFFMNLLHHTRSMVCCVKKRDLTQAGPSISQQHETKSPSGLRMNLTTSRKSNTMYSRKRAKFSLAPFFEFWRPRSPSHKLFKS